MCSRLGKSFPGSQMGRSAAITVLEPFCAARRAEVPRTAVFAVSPVMAAATILQFWVGADLVGGRGN